MFERLGLRQPVLGSITVCIVVALYLLAALNGTFWSKGIAYLGQDKPALAMLAIALAAGFIALCVTFSVRYLTKPFLLFLLLTAGSASWFMDSYGVIIDPEMVRNAVETTSSEAGHFVDIELVAHVLLFAIVPSLLLLVVRIEHRPFWSKLWHNLAVIVPCVLILLGIGLANARVYSSLIREHRDWFATLNPIVPIGSAIRYAIGSQAERNIVAAPLGTDAKVSGTPLPQRKPRVRIVVVGETARAENFQLGGYARETNPELSKRDVRYFSNTSSCGTATAVSVPCMFSVYTRQQYTHRKGLSTQNVLDVLTNAGVKVEWWDNNTGSKAVADRVPYKELFRSEDPRFCAEGECTDDILLDGLDHWLDNVKGDSVLVLHQLGSHGPAYSKRYPERFRRFTPDCRSVDFAKCSHDEIMNAYDNSLLYTDYILATVIDRLREREAVMDTAMIYMSDHGESLGELGLFLHGAPYLIAPSQQTHIPFVLWLGDSARDEIDLSCLKTKQDAAQSHDNLFHTVLGMMHVETKVRDQSLDLYTACLKGR
ncbi:phosphoethanolamine--lipid A transferase [Rhizobium oryzicola]|uniref:Phosphoethanolamine--lipid A transferase n=1 Tax=Rhizobium oryzicola TaxID=1232668 RepID=A0ABT8SZG3_9HYPH|nr:phosphoethanolamine--lipid A transferase [Rhizobium oryzicola]MDO1583670.1 phosphoethanolamine--lipid A transferase [Rhizobium oryzicola]